MAQPNVLDQRHITQTSVDVSNRDKYTQQRGSTPPVITFVSLAVSPFFRHIEAVCADAITAAFPIAAIAFCPTGVTGIFLRTDTRQRARLSV